jgi:hypothetical protein
MCSETETISYKATVMEILLVAVLQVRAPLEYISMAIAILFRGQRVYWRSKRQPIVTSSTTEAEFEFVCTPGAMADVAAG